MSAPEVVAVRTRRLSATLVRPWGQDVRENHLIGVEVETADGLVGHGLSWTPSVGPSAVQAFIDDELAPRVVGCPSDPEAVWDSLWRAVHEAGGGGITTIALAGIDLALWDLTGLRTGRSLADLLGRGRDTVPVYGSGVNLHYTLDELAAQAQRFVAAGYDAVKVKVGSPDVGRDVERIAAVREIIGPHRVLMVDANQRWSVEDAVRAIDMLAPFGLGWVEEPLLADDLSGYRRLRGLVEARIALGENLHTIHRFRDFLEAGVVDVVQPNVVRVGGITPFLRIAELAEARGAELAPHLLPELSGPLALHFEGIARVEAVEGATFDALGALAGTPIEIGGGRLTASHRAGLGLALVPAEHERKVLR